MKRNASEMKFWVDLQQAVVERYLMGLGLFSLLVHEICLRSFWFLI